MRIDQRGSMEANGRWLPFTARATYRAFPLAFEWRARLRVMLGMWVDAVDGHADGEGWGGAKLWGLKAMGQRSGPDVLASQLIRNIAELAWLPELADVASGLSWVDAGEDVFEINAEAGEREVVVRFELDRAGDIVRASSPARPFDVPDGFEEAPWHCDFGDHRVIDGGRVPASVVATYDFHDEPWEYFRGEIIERHPL